MKKWIVFVLAATFAPALAHGIETGPDVGEPIPAIEALDQEGRKRTFENLRGPKGLLILFHRSADW